MSRSGFYFDPHARGLAVFMGATEALVMDLAWKHKQLTVKRALSLINVTPKPAYTTLMTIFNRLVDKKLLGRSKDSRHFVYAPVMSKEDFLKDRISRINACVTKNFPEYS